MPFPRRRQPSWEIGFVLDGASRGRLPHNSFPTKHLTLILTFRKLGSFCTICSSPAHGFPTLVLGTWVVTLSACWTSALTVGSPGPIAGARPHQASCVTIIQGRPVARQAKFGQAVTIPAGQGRGESTAAGASRPGRRRNNARGMMAFSDLRANSRIEKVPAETRPLLLYSRWARRSGRTPALPYPSAQQQNPTARRQEMQGEHLGSATPLSTCCQPSKRYTQFPASTERCEQ